MRKEMDHERCSELLLPFLREELNAPERQRVASHLETCSQCRDERDALSTILAQEVVPLSGSERSSLRAAVAQELRDERPATKPSPAPERAGWFRRALPALGAAAVLILGVVFAANLSGGSDDTSGGALLEADRGGGGDAGGGGGAEAGEAEGAEDATGPEKAELDSGARPVPYFQRGPKKLDQARLRKLSRSEASGFRNASTLTEGKARSLVPNYAAALKAQAPEDVKDQLDECLASVSESQGTVLPTYATEGKYEGEDALLLGFVSQSDSGPFNRYMLWLWPKGSCEVPLEYVSGAIKE